MTNIPGQIHKHTNFKASNGCWEWLACKNAKGYAKIRYKLKYTLVHRVMYELNKGLIPPGMDVMHLCNNPGCINPEHLKVGTRQENMKHCVVSGRHSNKGNPNITGIIGVHLHKGKYWCARANPEGVRTQLYYGKDFFEACCARKSYEAKQVFNRGQALPL